jgi:hypothetical protein
MLVALLPSQISEYWPLMKGDINDSMPPIADWGPYDSNNILYALSAGLMQCWLVNDKEQKTKGFVTTAILRDISGVSTLLIYNAIVLENTSISDWSSGYDTLVKFASSKGCSKIGGFVQNEKILALLQDHDFETRFIFAHRNIGG